MHPEAERLFALEEALRTEAERVLRESGLGDMLARAGYEAAGSYALRTMTWRHLDFHRPETVPDWEGHWELGDRLARSPWCWRIECLDNHRMANGQPSLYWGLRLADPAIPELVEREGPDVWKIDLLSMSPEDFRAGRARRERWMAVMTEECRAAVLLIKDAVCRLPEYRRELTSVHIYEAVLEHGIGDLEGFRRWWSATQSEEAGL